MNDLFIYPMDESNVIDVLEINNICFNPPWSLESLKNELKNKFTRYIVVKKDDIVIGYAGIWIIIDEAHITNIAVDPDFRGIGAGNVLIENIIDICKELEIPSITLEVRETNTVAKNLYKKYGFIEEGIRKNYYEDGTNAVLMWKRNVL
ncbi:MAG: ribosomal protein S18-alanine N-acetyltransferase [Clostridium sp.]|nr:ribosomal protein S18-alanine N-acetyltransferase [Clostridium sp.]